MRVQFIDIEGELGDGPRFRLREKLAMLGTESTILII